MPISESNLEAMFTMESDPRGVIEEPPFRMLVVGDWSGSGAKKDLMSRRPINIDRDNFDDVMARIRTSLVLDLHGDGSNPLALTFSELDDFHPDRIFQQVPMFSELRDVRRRLLNQDTFFDAARDVRSWFPKSEDAKSEPAPEPESSEDGNDAPQDLLGQILSQPGGGKPVRSGISGSSELNTLLADLVRPHLVRVDENEQSRLLAAVDAATGDLMRAILHDHRFQALEAAWRGLYFMVRRTETDSDLTIQLLDIRKDELADNLKGVSSLSDSSLYKTLITDTLETPGGEPWSVVVGAFAFAPDVDDIATLVRISKLAADANAPFVSHMRPDVLGIASLEGHTDPKTWNLSPETDAGKLWSALRSLRESRYLGLTIPRFLARLPYGTDTEPLETFSFEEFTNDSTHDDYLWANSCFACGLLLAQSYSENGWEMGSSLKQDIEGLPVHVYNVDGETIHKPSAEVQLTEIASDQLMAYGLMPLVSYKNSDHARLTRIQSITDPVTQLKARWN